MSLFFTTVIHQDNPDLRLALTIEEEPNGGWEVKSGRLQICNNDGSTIERMFSADQYLGVLKEFGFEEAEIGMQIEEKLEKHHDDGGIL